MVVVVAAVFVVVAAVAVVVVGVEAGVLLQDGYLKLEIVTAAESGKKCFHLDLEHGSGLGQGQDFEFGYGYGHGFENSAAPR